MTAIGSLPGTSGRADRADWPNVPRFLASVTSVTEAGLAVRHGADIVDAKDPAAGALGALPLETVAAIRASLPASVTVSATVGDLPCEPDHLVPSVMATAATGVDLVKVGIFPGGDPHSTIADIGRLDLGRVRLVGLLLADRDPDLQLVSAMANAGFAGVMLDTADKSTGSLFDVIPPLALAAFVADVQRLRLFAGLAGSLRLSHVAALVRLKADVLGFRGALCDGAQRRGRLDGGAIAAVRASIDSAAAVADINGTPT